MSAYVPPGWPSGVHPPVTEDFERTAQAWLLDTVPADYRLHGVLRRYPLALAAMAIHHTRACVTGAREGYRTARTELGATLPPHALELGTPADDDAAQPGLGRMGRDHGLDEPGRPLLRPQRGDEQRHHVVGLARSETQVNR